MRNINGSRKKTAPTGPKDQKRPAQRFCGGVIAVLNHDLFCFPSSNAYHLEGIADNLDWALLALRPGRHHVSPNNGWIACLRIAAFIRLATSSRLFLSASICQSTSCSESAADVSGSLITTMDAPPPSISKSKTFLCGLM
jgi:hypothetical protein